MFFYNFATFCNPKQLSWQKYPTTRNKKPSEITEIIFSIGAIGLFGSRKFSL